MRWCSHLFTYRDSRGARLSNNVRPSSRRRGYATAMLAAALPVASGVGVERALLTVNVKNTASRRVIEANGGQLDKTDGNACYYWISTCSALLVS